MRKIKFIIPLLILFLTIGFAAVNFSLSINGDTEITGNLDNFNVYFSRVLVNGETNNNIVSSKTQLDFSGIIDKVGNTYTIEYDVTNASTVFDAEVTIKCTPSSEYLLVQNTFNVSSNLSALETRTGKLVLKKLKTISSDSSIYKTITCEIIATPIERESEVTGSIPEPLNPTFIGQEVSIGTEKFNVISSTEDTVTMLAKSGINDSYVQGDTNTSADFGGLGDWGLVDIPTEIDIQKYDNEIKNRINGYVEFLSKKLNSNNIKGDLISLKQLGDLGCDIPEDYKTRFGIDTCKDSSYYDWLINDSYWWTKTVRGDYENTLWVVADNNSAGNSGALSPQYFEDWIVENEDGEYDKLSGYHYNDFNHVRPTITLPMDVFAKLKSSEVITYKVGREVSIGDEKFNVISDNGLTVTMLAKYNLGTDYRQSTSLNQIRFSEFAGWDFEATDINIQNYDDGNVKSYINNYVEYLQTEIGDMSLVGDLVSLKQLKELGCTIQDDYSWTGNENCNESQYKSWIYNGQSTWTRSVYDSTAIWILSSDSLGYIPSEYSESVRPTITISKETLHYIDSLKNYEVGEVVSIEDENFNVISQTATTVTMLAQYNLGADFKQTTNQNYVSFSDGKGWEFIPAPKEIDIEIWSSNPKNYIKGYVSYLEMKTRDSNIEGDLLTLGDLKELNCTIPSSYGQTTDDDTSYRTCQTSPYVSWLNNGMKWWLRSAYSYNSAGVWRVNNDGDLYGNNFSNLYGIRPTITISKETLKYLASQKKYEIGQEIAIGTEKFNVISDNGTTISMLAQYNLGADFKQTTNQNYISFSDGNGWEYKPGPKEIDVETWSPYTSSLINGYENGLKTILGNSTVKGDLITVSELDKLGCTVPTDYALGSGGWTCTSSEYNEWLVNGQSWWTRSAYSTYSSYIWFMYGDGAIYRNNFDYFFGIRPVITISKSAL